MSQTLLLDENLYSRLETTARNHGVNTVQQLLEIWLEREEELKQRQEVVSEIVSLRARLYEKYGEMPDSTALIREDRER